MKAENESDLLTTGQIEEKYGIPSRRLRRHLRSKHVVGAYKDDQGRWRVPQQSFEAYLQSQGFTHDGLLESLLDYWDELQVSAFWRLVALAFGVVVVVGTIVGLLADVSDLVLNKPLPDAVATSGVASETNTNTNSDNHSTTNTTASQVVPYFVGSEWTYQFVELKGTSSEKVERSEGQFQEKVVTVENAFGDYSRIIGIEVTGDSLLAPCVTSQSANNSPDYWIVVTATAIYYTCDRLEVNSIVQVVRESVETGKSIPAGVSPEFELPLEVGKTWGEEVIEGAPTRDDTAYQWYVQAQVDVAVPAGEFTDCFKVIYYTLPEDLMRWVCPEVGIVAGEYHHHGSQHDYRFELTGWKPVSLEE